MMRSPLFGPEMPRPEITVDSAAFWEACAEHRLLIQRCLDCGLHRMNPAPVCFSCRSFRWDWEASQGQGSVFTYTVVHHPVHPAMQDSVPYIAVVVELSDCGGVRLTSNLVDSPGSEVAVGMAVEVVWEDVSPGYALYRFRSTCNSGE